MDTNNPDIFSKLQTTGCSIFAIITKRGETTDEKNIGRITAKVFGTASQKTSNIGVVIATANHCPSIPK
jgi:hypothetical protein